MKNIVGSPGTVSGLILRVGQCLCAAAAISTMASAPKFSRYTAFCYLIASMGLQVLWSLGLMCLDIYSLRTKRDLQNPVIVTATLSLAAACSSAGVVILYAKDLDFCRFLPHHSCSAFQISICFAFVAWFLMAMSSHVMFWLLASTY
ncbi:hypothetical protein AQUCO_00300173v1 [Aquilegia coerulea]|uniref:CASP-like protein n=1 Tax=Aquilegia coerulea TaxID=218851 RepID=A0A2G5EXK0_AQUCA|nr:hypothetical protein AQUCO_00300173v1 [Aquilegia coerulea]